MLLTNFTFAVGDKLPHYQQLVNFMKDQIHQGILPEGSQLPSIRKLAQALLISKTTVATVYEILEADGYLVTRPQKGVYVAELPVRPAAGGGRSDRYPSGVAADPDPLPKAEIKSAAAEIGTISAAEAAILSHLPPVRYNFASSAVDANAFPTSSWRRYLNYALRDPQILSRYGSCQGEKELRQALAAYSRNSRSVSATPEQIVVGSGIQNLLSLAAALLHDLLPSPWKLALEEPGFPKAEEIFQRQNWSLEHFSLAGLKRIRASALYLAPSSLYRGRSLSAAQRQDLLYWCQNTGGYILEDDYNGEFRYLRRPVSSLQGLSDGTHIIYLGSFSRLLLPGLRISYMVLPPALLPRYTQLGPLYNQTASTIEQLALAGFINDGELRRHVRRLRHLYDQKNILLRQCLHQYLSPQVIILANESALHLRLAVRGEQSAAVRAKQAREQGVQVLPLSGSSEILLSVAGLCVEDILPAVRQLQKAWC